MKHRGKVYETRQSFRQKLRGGVVGTKLQASMAGLELSLSRRSLEVVACLDCVPRDRSCIPSSSECSLHNDLEDHLGPEDIGFSCGGNDLELSVCTTYKIKASWSSYHKRLKSYDNQACSAPYCLLATDRRTPQVRDCACVVWTTTAAIHLGL